MRGCPIPSSPPAITRSRWCPRQCPPSLVVTSRTDSGVIMGLRHRELPIEGVQFHPEAVLTEGGHRLLGNWLETTGLTDAAARGAALSPRR